MLRAGWIDGGKEHVVLFIISSEQPDEAVDGAVHCRGVGLEDF